jgi:hypothetical protein
MEINLNTSKSNGRSLGTESLLKKIIFSCIFSAVGALFTVFWGMAFYYSPFWFVCWTLFGLVFGGVSQYNSVVGRIFNAMVYTLWYRMLVYKYERPPSGFVFLGAILGVLFFASLTAFIILSDNFFWFKMSKHTDEILPKLIFGAVAGLIIYFFRMQLLSIVKVSRKSMSDEFVGAAKRKDLDRLSMLLRKGAKINTKEFKSDDTALIAAAYYGYEEVVRFLIAKGVNVNIHGVINNSTALQVSAQENHLNIVKMLINNGAKINDFDKNGFTALGLAATRGHCDIVRELVSSGSNVNDRSNDGRTPLMMAAQNDKIDVVKLLLKNGADTNVRCINGKTAEMYAKERNHFKIAQLLKEK